MTGWAGKAILGDGNVPPYVHNPVPPDSAESVALDQVLRWDSWACCNVADYYYIAFGTDPDPPWFVGQEIETKSFDPGPLQPNTTYYWQVAMNHWWGCPGGGSAVSPVWHFTTEPSNPVENTTWGRIKALYR
jgi:hypothetical protein